MNSPKTFYIRQHHTGSEPDRKNFTDQYKGKPVACVVYERHKDPDIETEDYVIFAYAMAHPKKDQFFKKEGRRIAAERLNDNDAHLCGFTLSSTAGETEVIRQIMTVMRNEDLPRRVTKVIVAWLEKKL